MPNTSSFSSTTLSPDGSDPVAAASARACLGCEHAFVLRGEQWCGLSPGAFLCSEERAIRPLKALLLRACGTHGRFFSPRQT